MRTTKENKMRKPILLLAAGFWALVATAAQAQDVNWGKVDAALGRKQPSRAMSTATDFRAPISTSRWMASRSSRRSPLAAGLPSCRRMAAR
jgi:hypothetical protein